MKWKGRPQSKNVIRVGNYNNYPKGPARTRATAYEGSKIVIRKALAEKKKVKPKGPNKRAVKDQHILRHMRRSGYGK